MILPWRKRETKASNIAGNDRSDASAPAPGCAIWHDVSRALDQCQAGKDAKAGRHG